MMKVLKGIKIFAALILTLTFIALVPINTVAAAENNGKYVSEVYVAYGKNADAAKKVLGRASPLLKATSTTAAKPT